MNSRWRVPYSARMLLPPEAQGQFLPTPLQIHAEGEGRLDQRMDGWMEVKMDELGGWMDGQKRMDLNRRINKGKD